MDNRTMGGLAVLTAFAFLATFGAVMMNPNSSVGMAYNFNSGECAYCSNYCDSTLNDAGTIVSSESTNIKSLGDGCSGSFDWVEPNTEVKLCCK